MTQRRSSGLLDDFIREREHRGPDVEANSDLTRFTDGTRSKKKTRCNSARVSGAALT